MSDVVITTLRGGVGFQLQCAECDVVILSRDKAGSRVRAIAVADMAARHECKPRWARA